MNKKATPIIFNAAEVRATLSGAKTQFRRIIRDQPVEACEPIVVGRYCPAIELSDGMLDAGPEIFGASNDEWGAKCPYGEPGDLLWVREYHARVPNHRFHLPHYFADGPLPTISERHDAGLLKPYSPIFLPRWASRITLEIADVRVERVQDISEADAIAEGIEPLVWKSTGEKGWMNYDPLLSRHVAEWAMCISPVESYQTLWESIHGAESWALNPWVWVVEFRRI